MRFKVIMKWVAERNRWDVMKDNGFTMYDIPACENVDRIFDHPSKEKDEVFVIDIKREK